jgi:hypothetical protein
MAELTRYELKQARYGELREGEAVLIFVTEDFLSEKQVKLEDYNDESRGKSIPVMKLNYTAHFNTGIYPYTVMTSSFTPASLSKYPHSIKLTSSVQEWCGQTFLQFNLRNEQFQVKRYSYFEKEADESWALDAVWLEDELWNRIRLDPSTLPVGKIKVIPGAIQARFLHRKPAVEDAEGSLVNGSGSTVSYKLKYQSYERTFIITFEKKFPYTIVSFENIYKDGFGDKATVLRSTAIRSHSIMLDYWRHNANEDSTYRNQLGLE